MLRLFHQNSPFPNFNLYKSYKFNDIIVFNKTTMFTALCFKNRTVRNGIVI